jgi:hypothetical protein
MILSHLFTFVSGAAVLAALQRYVPMLGSGMWTYLQAQVAARRIVALQLDPLLKAADELQGKLLSLAKEDFTEFRRLAVADAGPGDLVNLCSTLFLFGQLWARFEILRRESFHAELARDKKGAQMLTFVQSLESRKVRLVDRAWQRAMGESLIVGSYKAMEIRPFREFVEDYESSEKLRRWFEPLAILLRETPRSRKVRQRMLQYGVVVHAMIDTLDPKHHSTKNRPGYPNKLSRRSRRDLTGRAFGVYLPEVRDIEKYTGER